MSLTLLVVAALTGSAGPVEAPADADRIAPVVVRIVPAAVTSGGRDQPVICRSTLETGSLIIRRKSCLTAKQWSYVDDAHQDAARRLVATATGGVGQ